MNRAASFARLAAIDLDPGSSIPLYRQLYEHLRSTVLTGRIAGGTRIPSSRALASALGVSRNTIIFAYDQLKLEGFFEGRSCSGTYVSRSLPDGRERVPDVLQELMEDRETLERRGRGGLSSRGARLRDMWRIVGRDRYRATAFRPGLPALDTFPLAIWNRLATRRWRDMPADLLTYGDPAGYRPLRELIAAHVFDSRGLRCSADRIIIVSGAPEAIALASTVLLDRGDIVWLEDPGSTRARGIFTASDAQVVPIPVDRDGIDLEVALKRAPKVRMIYVTPSCQYPLGTCMSLARRMELLRWASQTEAWIVEDSFASELQATGAPITALQTEPESGCVVHIGSFGQLLFPAASLGYLIVPDQLVDSFLSARLLTHQAPPLFGQVIMADFLSEGHLDRHMRRTRSLLSARRDALVDALTSAFGDLLELQKNEDASHVVAFLPAGVDDRILSRRIARFDVEAPPLSFYAVDPLQRGGFVLGYAAVDEQAIRIAVQRMHKALDGMV